MACACNNCSQRADWCRANGLVVEGETERKTWSRECWMGNAIIQFNGIEHCKAWKISEKSGVPFVVCTKCTTQIFEINPLFNPNAFNIPENGMKWDVVDVQPSDETTRNSSHNADLDPKYDPERKNINGVYKG